MDIDFVFLQTDLSKTIFIALHPDIVFVIAYFSYFVNAHNHTHYEVVKSVMHYLKGIHKQTLMPTTEANTWVFSDWHALSSLRGRVRLHGWKVVVQWNAVLIN